ncbi:hypothetical protein Droror1_Dr00017546 [Drosera rotundifolia]
MMMVDVGDGVVVWFWFSDNEDDKLTRGGGELRMRCSWWHSGGEEMVVSDGSKRGEALRDDGGEEEKDDDGDDGLWFLFEEGEEGRKRYDDGGRWCMVRGEGYTREEREEGMMMVMVCLVCDGVCVLRGVAVNVVWLSKEQGGFVSVFDTQSWGEKSQIWESLPIVKKAHQSADERHIDIERRRKLEFLEIEKETPEKEDQLCDLSHALALLASASSVSREQEEFLSLVKKEIELYNSMANKEGDVMMAYGMESYGHYMRGEDELMATVDEEFAQKLQSEKEAVIQKNQALENEIKELEKELESYRSCPTPKEVLEKEKTIWEEDVKKFQDYIKDLTDGL